MTSHVEMGCASDVGRVREQNEDSFHADDRAGLFLVADGMGGHAAGEIASSLATRSVVERMSEASGGASTGELRDRLGSAIRAAGRRIWEEGRQHPDRRGMGTTLTALLLGNDTAILGHVGDSRAYRYRGGELEQLTEDHSLHPGSSVLTRALGTEERTRPDLAEHEARPGDLFLLASDGLTDEVSDALITEILGRSGAESGDEDPAGRAARELVDAALSAGGRDNVTVVVIRLADA